MGGSSVRAWIVTQQQAGDRFAVGLMCESLFASMNASLCASMQVLVGMVAECVHLCKCSMFALIIRRTHIHMRIHTHVVHIHTHIPLN
jgi:hypothetical protein